AMRRAEEAERLQQDLQTEGTTLMRSLDEMRPKIVELTGAKLELVEKVDELERIIQGHEDTIAALRQSLEDSQQEKAESLSKLEHEAARNVTEATLTQTAHTELQNAYGELQAELDALKDNMLTLQMERSSSSQAASRTLEEASHLSGTVRSLQAELASVRTELEERRQGQDEGNHFLASAQNEIEALRMEVAVRDEEIEHLQLGSANTPTAANGPHSLDAEMLGSLRQQHAFDMSAAHSQIRALENKVFEAEARAHALQKHVSALEDSLTRASSATVRRESTSISRPSSRASLDYRRPSSSLSTSQKNLPTPLARTMFDQNLSEETLHKRKISLGMLKVRMDSEIAAASGPSRSKFGGELSTIVDVDDGDLVLPRGAPQPRPLHRPQFLDDEHVFWCSACQGDLVVL
ncbi:hypothetical protein FISHEDRAFT_47472, partial [Fistulina hepatica ATCC 64428]